MGDKKTGTTDITILEKDDMIGVIIVRYNGCVFSQASSQIFSDNKKVFRTEVRSANILL